MVLFDWLNELAGPCCITGPCFNCPGPASKGGRSHRDQILRTLRSPGHEVELAISPIGRMRGLAGYHSSLLIAGEEYYFSPTGIHCYPKIYSHPDEGVTKVFIGLSEASGAEMLCFLSGHFQPGSYDLLRKNCNTFTDCALYFLCGKRLDMRYKAVETLACMADERTGILQSITRGEYSPNPEAEDFSLQTILQEIDVRWDACESDCSEDDIDAMRSQTLSLNEMRPVPPVRYSERLPEEAELPVPGERFCKLADAEVTEMVEIVVDDDTFV